LINPALSSCAPAFATEGAAAADLVAAIEEAVVIPPCGRALVPSGVAIELPSNEYAAFVFARSGLSSKHGICLANGVGVIDADYRGEIKVALINLSDEAYTVAPGDRIAQLSVMKIARFTPVVVSELGETARSDGGFGSTGK